MPSSKSGTAELTDANLLGQLVPQIEPKPGEFIVRKTQALAFFGTGFSPWLVSYRCLRKAQYDRLTRAAESNKNETQQKPRYVVYAAGFEPTTMR